MVCPLNWGLGHAARDVAIIQTLLKQGHEVILAAEGNALEMLSSEFPDLETHRLGEFARIRYSLHLPAWLKITFLSPLILLGILIEHYSLNRLVKIVQPDVVVSDNRYGLWHRRVYSILVTHQLSIRLPGLFRFLEYPLSLVLKIFIGKFDVCWIPDYPGKKNLSGELTHRFKLPVNAVFVGAISRFTEENLESRLIPHSVNTGMTLDLLILLSGPEPQRSQLEQIVIKQALTLKSNCIILQGLPGKLAQTDLVPNVTMYSHLPAWELKKLILIARNIICRAGYTGIMDLVHLSKKALIIPTPGQTEQEYLSFYLAGKGVFLSCTQDKLNLESALEALKYFNPKFNFPGDALLEKEILKLNEEVRI